MGASLCKRDKISDEAANNNKKIEMEIKKDWLEERRIVKILLLGSADSGKSTIAKQMRILHTDGFNETELINYRYMIHTNFIVTYHCIVRGLYQLGIQVPSEEKDLVAQFDTAYTKFLDWEHQDQIQVITKIRAFKCINEVCKRLSEFYVPDNTTYLLAEADRILQDNYRPSQIDVLHARASTTGVHEIVFAFRKFGIRLIDVGGQKTERRKWIHCFDSVSAILYVISLSAYDQFLEEDPTINRMDDSVELFKKMYQNVFLEKCSFILFLNKKDLFEKKILRIPLQKFFPAFQANSNTEDQFGEAVEFVKKLFMDTREPDDVKHVYTHVTNATDTKNIEFVFGATCDIILQNNLTKAGMT